MSMRGLTLRLFAVVCCGVAVPTLTGLPVAASATSYHYYVDGRLVDRSLNHIHSFVRDVNGRSHVALVGRDQRVRYLTRAHGSETWRTHTIPGLTDSNVQSRVRLGLSPDRRTVYLAANCVGGSGLPTGLYVLKKPGGRTNFARPSKADLVQPSVCNETDSGANRTLYDVLSVVGLPSGKVALLYAQQAAHQTHLWVASGTPGDVFTRHELPGQYSGAAQLSRDHST